MNAASLLELLNVPVAVAATPAQAAAPPVLTFQESLVLASQAPASPSTANLTPKDFRQTQKTVSVDVKPPAIKLQPTTATPSLVTPQPTPPLQPPVPQPLRVQTAPVPSQLIQAATVIPVASTTPAIVLPTVANRYSLASSHSTRATSTTPSTAHGSPSASGLLIAVAGVSHNTLPLPTATNSLLNAAPLATSFNTEDSRSSPVTTSQPAARPEASLPDAVSAPTVQVAPIPLPSVVQDAVAVTAPKDAPQATAPVADADLLAIQVPHSVPVVAPATVAQPHPVAVPIIAPVTVAKAPAPSAQSVTDAQPLILKTSPSAAAPLHLAPAPVAHEAVNPSPTQVAAPKADPGPATQVNAPQASPSPENSTTPPPAPADPLIAVTQPPQVAVAVNTPAVLPAGATNLKNVTVKAPENATRVSPHAPPASGQSAVPSTSQAASQSGEQSQGNAPQQDQSATPAPASVVNHTPAAPGETPVVAAATVPLQTTAPPAAAQAHTAKAPDAPTPVLNELPQQPAPVINTARLIQTVGQSEMRVGMRSNDFGNISIRTSTTRDLISAQISLDHGDLAKALATHVPEIQARMGGNQAMEVRIDMNSQAIGQGGAASPGMSTASGDGSRGEQQSRGNAAPTQQNEKVHGTASTAAPQAEVALHTRLDVRG